MKKILGFAFLLLALILGLAFISQIPKLLGIILRAFSGDADDIGYLMGTVIWWTLYLGVVYILIKYGKKWTRKTTRTTQHYSNVLDEDLAERK
jgi:hypothetical protein